MESAKAFQAFCAYRDMGAQRSQREVARQLGKSTALISRWSAKWRWVERCAMWDGHLDQESRTEELEQRKEMVDFHARLARQVLNKVAQRIVGNDEAGVVALDPNSLSAADVARWLDTAAKLERLSRGEPTAIERRDTGLQEATAEVREMIKTNPHLALKMRELSLEISSSQASTHREDAVQSEDIVDAEVIDEDEPFEVDEAPEYDPDEADLGPAAYLGPGEEPAEY